MKRLKVDSESVGPDSPLKAGATQTDFVRDIVLFAYAASQEFLRCRARRMAARAKSCLGGSVGLRKLIEGCGPVLALCLAFIVTDVHAADAVQTPTTPSADACLPFDMPASDILFSSPKKVFAHYFNRLPLSIDNRVASADYYSLQYLNPGGEGNKWLANGGYLRSRPLPVPVGRDSDYIVENLKREIKLAISRGITGFTFDILSLEDIQPGSYLPNMLRAASEVDNRFQIVLMPDMSALGPDTGNVIKIIKAMYDQQGLFHLPDGRLVVSPFLSESVSPAAWKAFRSQLEQDGMKIAFVPTFLSPKYFISYSNLGDGLGTFGTPLPTQGAVMRIASAVAHAEGEAFMAGISGQGYRPKDYSYWESQGSLAYRNSWLGAIEGGADWMQLTTWNDFGESTQIAPYTDRSGSAGTGFFNLTGFYASWFLTGKAPTIGHDVLYYFYRRHPVGAVAQNAGQQTRNAVFWQPGRDVIEVLGFLKTPGTLAISIDGNEYKKKVDAGIQSFSVPLGVGTPRFSLLRENSVVISFEGATRIVGESDLPGGFADLTYWSGSASEKGTCFSDAIQW